MAAATAIAAQGPARVDAPPARKAPGSVPVRIPAPRRPLDDAVWLLEHHPEAAGEARQATRTTLDRWNLGAEAADAVVLVASRSCTRAGAPARRCCSMSDSPPFVL